MGAKPEHSCYLLLLLPLEIILVITSCCIWKVSIKQNMKKIRAIETFKYPCKTQIGALVSIQQSTGLAFCIGLTEMIYLLLKFLSCAFSTECTCVQS